MNVNTIPITRVHDITRVYYTIIRKIAIDLVSNKSVIIYIIYYIIKIRCSSVQNTAE